MAVPMILLALALPLASALAPVRLAALSHARLVQPNIFSARHSAILMRDPAEIQAEMQAMQKKLELLQLQKKLEELQSTAPPPAPVVIEPTVPAPPVEALQKKLELLQMQAKLQELEKLKAASPPPVIETPAAVVPTPPVEAVAPDTAAALQKKLELLQLQKKLQDLEKLKAAPPPVVEAPPAAVVPAPPVEAVAPDAAAALQKKLELLQLQAKLQELQKVSAAPQAVLEAPAAIAPPPAAVAADAVMQAPAAVQEAASAAASAAASGGGTPAYLGVVVPLVLAPVAFFGFRALKDFVDTRYDELQGAPAEGAAPAFAPRAPGNELANRLQNERAADAEVAAAMEWDAPATKRWDGTRNARDIFEGGLGYLASDPTGWLFGPPSALYSNAPAKAAAPPAAAVPSAAVAAPEAAPPMAPPADALAGRVVPSGASVVSKRGRRKRSGAKATTRVPPSTPEELAKARAGEYDFYPED